MVLLDRWTNSLAELLSPYDVTRATSNVLLPGYIFGKQITIVVIHFCCPKGKIYGNRKRLVGPVLQERQIVFSVYTKASFVFFLSMT